MNKYKIIEGKLFAVLNAKLKSGSTRHQALLAACKYAEELGVIEFTVYAVASRKRVCKTSGEIRQSLQRSFPLLGWHDEGSHHESVVYKYSESEVSKLLADFEIE